MKKVILLGCFGTTTGLTTFRDILAKQEGIEVFPQTEEPEKRIFKPKLKSILASGSFNELLNKKINDLPRNKYFEKSKNNFRKK